MFHVGYANYTYLKYDFGLFVLWQILNPSEKNISDEDNINTKVYL